MGYTAVAPGQTITANWANGVANQVVMRFANAAARTAALPSPTAGMVSWLDDVKALQVYRDGAWQYESEVRLATEVTGVAQTAPCKNTGADWIANSLYLKKGDGVTDWSWTFTLPTRSEVTVTLSTVVNKSQTAGNLSVALEMTNGGWASNSYNTGHGVPYSWRLYHGLTATGPISLVTHYTMRAQSSTQAGIDLSVPAGTTTVKIPYGWNGTNDQAHIDHIGLRIVRESPRR